MSTDALLALALTLAHFAAATAGSLHALVYKRDPRAATGWVAVCILVPFFGPLAYYLLGINRVRARARKFRRSRFSFGHERGALPSTGDAALLGLQRIGARLSHYALRSANRISVLHNGDATYPAMLAAIESARSRVLLATYIFRMDGIGARFAAALEDAVRRGVEVSVLVDGIGELYSWPPASRMLRARDIKVARFLPPRLWPPSVHLNLRNHRKILVTDGYTAFIGGMNISDTNLADGGRERLVTDMHFELCGSVVADVERMIHEDWHFATNEPLSHPAPAASENAGDAECRLISDGPDEALDRLALLIQTMVAAAERQVDIMTPYFLPSRELIGALQSAALEDIRVRIVLPGKNNLFYMHWANRNMLAELLPWGVEIYYQPAPFCHSKLLLIDGEYALLGSANLDPRSLRLNFELGLEVWSPSLSAELAAHVDAVVARSRPVALQELDGRALPIRIRDSATALFSPYL